MLIDVNGAKKPNKVGKDILLLNSTISVCDIKIEGLDFCLAGSNLELSKENLTVVNASWGAGAALAEATEKCEAIGMHLPTLNQLARITEYLYDGCLSTQIPLADRGRCSGAVNTEKASELNWTGSAYFSLDGATRYFYSHESDMDNDGHVFPSSYRARCVK